MTRLNGEVAIVTGAGSGQTLAVDGGWSATGYRQQDS